MSSGCLSALAFGVIEYVVACICWVPGSFLDVWGFSSRWFVYEMKFRILHSR